MTNHTFLFGAMKNFSKCERLYCTVHIVFAVRNVRLLQCMICISNRRAQDCSPISQWLLNMLVPFPIGHSAYRVDELSQKHHCDLDIS